MIARRGALDISWVHHDIDEATDEFERRCIAVSYVHCAHKRRREIILPSNPSGYVRPIEADEQGRFVRSIAQGRAWLRQVVAGTTTQAIASHEGKSERTIRLILSLALLDPKMVRAAILGSLPRGVSTKRLLHAPADWHQQWPTIGLDRPA